MWIMFFAAVFVLLFCAAYHAKLFSFRCAFIAFFVAIFAFSCGYFVYVTNTEAHLYHDIVWLEQNRAAKKTVTQHKARYRAFVESIPAKWIVSDRTGE